MSSRLAVDIGGTFTDVVLETGTTSHSIKILTTPDAPERAVLEGVRSILAEAKCRPQDVSLVVHGTTLATNALIERKGARTALVTTEGFRDSVEMAWEHRFEQYDIYMERPQPLVSRDLRFGVPERVASDGAVLLALDEAAVHRVAAQLKAEKIEAVAVCFLHSFTNEAHERRTGEILAEALPGVAISLSCEVCPEIREYERTSTTIANAYVLPRMAGYLGQLEADLKKEGIAGPLLLMMSSGGITTVDTARRYPVRLVESGPAGGAILARTVAAENDAARRSPSTWAAPRPSSLCSTIWNCSARASSRSLAPIASCRAPACRCASPSSSWSRSVPAAARSRASMRWAASRSVPIRPAACPAPRATVEAAPSRPSPTPIRRWDASIPRASPVAPFRFTATRPRPRCRRWPARSRPMPRALRPALPKSSTRPWPVRPACMRSRTARTRPTGR